jgi:dienelactone hydrolase
MPIVQKSSILGPALLGIIAGGTALGDTVALKNGLVYRGTIDRDNSVLSIFDGLKRVILRDSKVDHIESDASFRNLERFQLIQPLEVHAGTMPVYVIEVRTSPWDEFGRRKFSYVGSRSSQPVTMKQAIIEMDPHMVKLRGVDGFWPNGLLDLSQVPKKVVLGLLAKIDPKNQNERLRACRFLIQAGWYPEARVALARVVADFPEVRETIQNVERQVRELEARQALAEIAIRVKAQQPREVVSRLKTFPIDGAPLDVMAEVRNQLRRAEAQADADKALAESLQSLAGQLPEEMRIAWKKPLVEILRALDEAPEAVRGRLEPFRKADPATAPEARFALAMTGWVVGAGGAVADLASAEKLWRARELIQNYLSANEAAASPSEGLTELQEIAWTDAGHSARKMDQETVTRIVRLMPPPLRDEEEVVGERKLYRVLGDDNPAPTEYAVLLPPEYHPLRSYPAVVALHAGHGPRSAIDWWAEEAQRRGYIVIAPEYNLPGQEPDYRYTISEHAAVELALRDARKRFAIDSNRVFLGGQLLGGNMAWDYGLGHPDLFAGLIIISGLPAKYVDWYRNHVERLPLYVVNGDLAPTESEMILPWVKALILRAWDVTYVEYFRRGLEDLPEEAPHAFDWMDHHKPRDPYPKKFKVSTARECDARFYGIVIRQFAEGRATDPQAVELFGKNLNPATIDVQTSSLSNLIKVTADGIRRLDVWVSPQVLDFKKKMEVRVNGRAYFKGEAKIDLQPLLEDLRLRGDRQQVYWLKVSAG